MFDIPFINQFVISNSLASEGNYADSSSIIDIACWVGIILTILDLIIYTTGFIYVYYRAGMANYGWGTFLILSFPILFLGLSAIEPILHAFTALYYPNPESDRCYVYNPNDPFAIVIESTQIINGILINIVMLKILGVAATLRCENKEQEERTVRRHSLLVKIYVPAYLIT